MKYGDADTCKVQIWCYPFDSGLNWILKSKVSGPLDDLIAVDVSDCNCVLPVSRATCNTGYACI